ncbi:MAG: carbamoyltransferase HypF [Bryobacteraceae bacterium]|nr:carbamoyltransferase HypF [Bryobacteraceae bacterium]
MERRRLLVRGVVQGVGFRPFVYTLAVRLGLTGFVRNTPTGVLIELQSEPEQLDAFHTALVTNPPPNASIDSIEIASLQPTEPDAAFRIDLTTPGESIETSVPPDLATCPACLRELRNPHDRRYRYPFLNCTHCGPRFTIIRSLPYDRPATTMAAFPLCPACAAEYHNPADRRFHAEPVACPQCGPALSFGDHRGEPALQAAQQALRRGGIVAIKGLGGFHLACDATNDAALRTLRLRKGRIDKPFALMVRDLAAARALCEVDDDEARLLQSRERPIVLLTAKPAAPLSALVAPRNRYLGVLLPYTPLHHLLIDDTPLVMTSGNRSDEPIAKDNAEALERLAPLADGFLLHDRDIHQVADDSVVRVFEGRELPLRRSRGYAPFPVRLPLGGPSVLAAGGELKATFCLTQQNRAYLSQHIGDMENLETLAAYERAVDHYQRLFSAVPAALAADLHPGYLSSQWARRYAADHQLPLIEVQHHHAHAAAVMAENQVPESEQVIAFAFDGTGYGADGAIWGGEVLIARYRNFDRYAHLRYVPLPGGDAAIRHPHRTAFAYLRAAGLSSHLRMPPGESALLERQIERAVNTIPASSMGRLFDAAAVLLGYRGPASYEGQPALELEAKAEDPRDPLSAFSWDISPGSPLVIDPAPLLAALVEELPRAATSALAWRFHQSVAALILRVALLARDESGLSTVALTGGVFQNVLLLRLTTPLLRAEGFRVLLHHRVPPNDGGLSLGQAAIAIATLPPSPPASSPR